MGQIFYFANLDKKEKLDGEGFNPYGAYYEKFMEITCNRGPLLNFLLMKCKDFDNVEKENLENLVRWAGDRVMIAGRTYLKIDDRNFDDYKSIFFDREDEEYMYYGFEYQEPQYYQLVNLDSREMIKVSSVQKILESNRDKFNWWAELELNSIIRADSIWYYLLAKPYRSLYHFNKRYDWRNFGRWAGDRVMLLGDEYAKIFFDIEGEFREISSYLKDELIEFYEYLDEKI